MPAQYTPYNFNLNQLSQDKYKPSPSLPFEPGDYKPYIQNVDQSIYLKLVNQYRNSFRHEVQDTNPFDIEKLANVYFMKSDFLKAEKYYDKVIKLSSEYLPAYNKVIQSLILQLPKEGEYTNKILYDSIRNKIDTYYTKFLTASNRRIDVLHNYVLFRLFFFQNETNTVNESIKLIDEVIEKQNNNFAALDTKGFIYLNYKNDIPEATKWFQKALKINSNYEHALNNNAVCLLRTNKIEAAEEQFKKIIDLNPKYVASYENLGYIYISRKNYPEALSYFERIIKINGQLNRNGYHNLAWLYGITRQFQKSIDLNLKILQAEKDNYLIMNNLATSYLRLGDNKNADKFYRDGIKTYKRLAWGTNIQQALFLFYNYGRMAINDKNTNLISSLIADIEKLDPKSVFNNYLKGMVELLTKKYKEASKIFRKIEKSKELIPDLYASYSFLLSAVEKDYKKAIEIIEFALSKGIYGTLIDNNLAYAYLLNGERNKAKKILDKYPSDNLPDIIAPTKGMFEIRNGNLEEGEYFYLHAISKFTDKDDKNILKQILLYEKALYYKNKDKQKAIKLLEEAEQYKDSYMTKDIIELKKKIMWK